MNLFHGRYVGGAIVLDPDLRVELPGKSGLAVGSEVTLGVRPEHVDIAPEGAHPITGRIELIEPTGFGTILHVAARGAIVKAFSLRRDLPAVGAAVGVGFDPDRLHLFDADGRGVRARRGRRRGVRGSNVQGASRVARHPLIRPSATFSPAGRRHGDL